MYKLIKIGFLFLALPTAVHSQKKEKWIDKPQSQWPRIALINHVQFKNGDKYIDPSLKYAGTGFLIDNGKDTLATTAKHVLWLARNKKSKAVEINAELKSWVMTPKGGVQDSVVIHKLLNEDPAEQLEGEGQTIQERDWLVFSVSKISPGPYPLKPRYTAVKPGEKVYILSCAYDDSLCTISEGKVYRKLGMDILIQRDMKAQKGGASGSPVIDANGCLVGVFSGTAGSPVGDVAVAISTEYLRNVLTHKPGLNRPKKDYGAMIYQTALTKGARAAIRQYRALTANPKNYYSYNLRSPNRNGLRETGEKLTTAKHATDAIAILKLNIEVDGKFFINYNALAKAYLLSGDKAGAIAAYRSSWNSYPDNENEAKAELEKLGVKL